MTIQYEAGRMKAYYASLDGEARVIDFRGPLRARTGKNRSEAHRFSVNRQDRLLGTPGCLPEIRTVRSVMGDVTASQLCVHA